MRVAERVCYREQKKGKEVVEVHLMHFLKAGPPVWRSRELWEANFWAVLAQLARQQQEEEEEDKNKEPEGTELEPSWRPRSHSEAAGENAGFKMSKERSTRTMLGIFGGMMGGAAKNEKSADRAARDRQFHDPKPAAGSLSHSSASASSSSSSSLPPSSSSHVAATPGGRDDVPPAVSTKKRRNKASSEPEVEADSASENGREEWEVSSSSSDASSSSPRPPTSSTKDKTNKEESRSSSATGEHRLYLAALQRLGEQMVDWDMPSPFLHDTLTALCRLVPLPASAPRQVQVRVRVRVCVCVCAFPYSPSRLTPCSG
jgi:hypothetical protein